MPEQGLTKTAFATRHGVAKSRVTELIGEGLPVLATGRIDPVEGDAWMACRLDPARRAAASRRGQVHHAAGKVADQRARKLDRENELLDLDLARKRGELISRDETLKALQEFGTLHRDAWLGWIARTVPVLCAAGGEPTAVFASLDKAVRDQLAEFARLPPPRLDHG
ncbi:hypothetical protein [Methylobacterium sp. A54F]